MTDALVRTALPGGVRVVDDGPLPFVSIDTPLAGADAYFHGAQLTRWHPSHAADPVLWLSRHSRFETNAAIRGGIPICFPWFGPHATDRSSPAHGLARLAEWALAGASAGAGGEVRLSFVLGGAADRWAAWPHAFEATLRVTIGASLGLTLLVENPGPREMTFEEALHTYLAIGDIERVSISGLEHTEYLDKVQGFARMRQGGDALAFTGETDRVYLETTASCVIADPVLRRRIAVRKAGSRTTVVWNPWRERARAFPDFGDDEWRGMVCVETANVGEAAVTLAPGERHAMSVEIGVENVQGD